MDKPSILNRPDTFALHGLKIFPLASFSAAATRHICQSGPQARHWLLPFKALRDDHFTSVLVPSPYPQCRWSLGGSAPRSAFLKVSSFKQSGSLNRRSMSSCPVQNQMPGTKHVYGGSNNGPSALNHSFWSVHMAVAKNEKE